MKKRKGFTLIELLVVIAIIGLLSTLAIVAMGNARQKSRDAKRISDVKQIQTALELYFNDQNGYPGGTNLILGTSTATCLDSGGFNSPCNGNTKYMANVPSYPTPSDGSNCAGAAYTYNSATTDTYNIQYCLGSGTGGVSGNTIHYATPAGLANP
jgi:general secretion pathway protein G